MKKKTVNYGFPVAKKVRQSTISKKAVKRTAKMREGFFDALCDTACESVWWPLEMSLKIPKGKVR